MALDKDSPIFDNKSFADIAKDIYESKSKKDTVIKDLVKQVADLIKTTHDATMLIPVIKEYLEVGVKNDEILVKLAVVIQRIMSDTQAASGTDDFGMSKEEKDRFMKEVESTIKAVDAIKLPTAMPVSSSILPGKP